MQLMPIGPRLTSNAGPGAVEHRAPVDLHARRRRRGSVGLTNQVMVDNMPSNLVMLTLPF